MTEVAKTTPQISEFLLSPLVKNPTEVKTPLQRDKILPSQRQTQPPKLDLKSLFDDCFCNAKIEKALDVQPQKKEEDFASLFQAKKTICKPKVFCANPRNFKGKFRGNDFDTPQILPEVKTSSSTSLKYIEEGKTPVTETSIDFEEAAYKTPTMKPKATTHKLVQCSTKTDKHQNSTPSLKEYYAAFGDFGMGVDMEKSRFFTEYELLETIGAGYFGKVLKCRNKLDGEIYAIKYIDNKGRGPLKAKRTMNEIHNLAKMSSISENSRTVRYYTSWLENDGFYIVMEYCKNNLQTIRMQTGQFSESELLTILKDLALALSDLHRNNIVHLDVKPENILLSHNNCFKLADFGLSRCISASNTDDVTEGDARYMAQELLNENKDLSKADIFSLGATLYELIIGEDLPCNGEEWHRIRQGNLEKLDATQGISRGLKELIKGMMAEEAKNRPSAEEILGSEMVKGAKNCM